MLSFIATIGRMMMRAVDWCLPSCEDRPTLGSVREGCTYHLLWKMALDKCPGVVAGVSVNGKTMWLKGVGYSNLRNELLCEPDAEMRIASISKSITMAAVARLIENGKLNIDNPVQTYVPTFPIKKYDGKIVTITTRMLLSHTSGLPHYKKPPNKSVRYPTTHYKTITEALDIFKDDPLVHEPGTKYHYSTYGWTLVSAVIEGASGENFLHHMQKLLLELGMTSTYPDSPENISCHMAQHYENGYHIYPEVDLSCKWAGGGFVSSVSDLLRFGNRMLNIYKDLEPTDTEPVFLKSETVRMMWTPVIREEQRETFYGMGWKILPQDINADSVVARDLTVFHTGSGGGASSCLLICPLYKDVDPLTSGIVVAVMANCQSKDLSRVAYQIANEFKVLVLQDMRDV